MKKFQTYDEYNEEHLRSQQRQKLKTEEPRKFFRHDSAAHRGDYFMGQNTPMEYHNHPHQIERRSKAASQAFVKIPMNQGLQNHDVKKTRSGINSTNECPPLNEVNKSTEQSGPKENYRNFHDATSFNSNKGNGSLHSRNPTFKDNFSNTKTKFKNNFSAEKTAEDECLNIRSNVREIGVNKDNPSINLDVESSQFEYENSLPLLQKYNETVYELNQSSQYYNKRNDDLENAYFQNFSKSNVYTHEERVNSQDDTNSEALNAFQKAAFQNHFASNNGTGFIMLTLTDLIYYNANLMQGNQLFEYASAMKCKILEKIDNFQCPEKDELEFLCEITDGDQTEKNQRVITTRTCHIVKNIIAKFPLIFNALETPAPSQVLVYQTAPKLCGMSNTYCNNYESQVLEIVQNSDMMFSSDKDYNLMSEYDITQNDKCIISKGISDTFDVMGSNNYRENCEVQNFNANKTKNNSPIDSSLITGENKDMAEESPEHNLLDINSQENTPVKIFSFDEKNSIFISFGLDSLLKYDIDTMHGDMVFDYAFSMKQKILEKIPLFMDPYKEKLKFLCELTDGTQLERNQKLINERMCDLITSACRERKVLKNSQNFSHQKRSYYTDVRRR